ncbi:MAG: hypothetical protein ABL957_07545 [Parvularculaceae bacterium]
MEEILAVEQRRRETPLEKLFRDSGAFSAALLRLAVLTAILTPIILASFLTLDLAVFRFDQIFDAAAQKPSNWLSVGGLVMVGAGLLVILFSRRFGGDEAARAITAAWGVTAIAAFAGLAELSPVLQDSDFPTVRTVVAFVASAMIGQYVAVSFYDVVRGGGPWWRAPLLAALIGLGLQAAIYYPWVFLGTAAPWFFWMIADFAVKAAAAVAFLPIYKTLQRPLRPRGGFGGR